MKNITKLLTSPGEAVLAAKKKPSYTNALVALVVAGIASAIAATIVSMSIGTANPIGTVLQQFLGYVAIGVFLVVLVAGLFAGLIVKLVATTLGGKGGYLQGLTAVAYTSFAPSIGILAAMLLGFVPMVGGILGFVALAVTLAVGIATLYRSISELFAADMVTSLVAVGVIVLALMLPFYYLLGGAAIQGVTGIPGLSIV